MAAPQQAGSDAQAPKPVKPPVIRMDRSRAHSSIHGERPAGDRHSKVFFYQDGLPFGADGVLVADHLDIVESEELQAKVAMLMKRAIKRQQEAPGDEENEENEAASDGPVNLDAWARGEEQPQWQQVSQTIARRFSKRVGNKRDALELLIAEKVVTIGALSKEHKKILDD